MPAELLEPIAIPARDRLKTVGDMAQLLLDDELAMAAKNADLATARRLLFRTEIKK